MFTFIIIYTSHDNNHDLLDSIENAPHRHQQQPTRSEHTVSKTARGPPSNAVLYPKLPPTFQRQGDANYTCYTRLCCGIKTP
jgi:hypothetical protein